MPAIDNYETELSQLRAALASGHVTIEAHGRRITYRSVADIRGAIDEFEALRRPRRRTRYRAVSLGTR